MDRRQFNSASLTGVASLSALLMMTYRQAYALSLSDLTSGEASQGLKLALEKGAGIAISLLGQPGGFLGNDKVRIPLPGVLNDAANLMKNFGQGKQVEELIGSMNHAAETAVPMAKDLLMSAVHSMNVTDAKNILSGGDNSVTQFFSDKTRDPLGIKFLPIVSGVVEKVGLTAKYNAFAGKVASFGLVSKEDANLQHYVTGKSLDGLYFVIGEQEKKIRQDPIGTGSAILGKVFGALK
jgi:hypothetical protein